MDPDETSRSAGGREPLRSILDEWRVREPPRKVEWQLRRTFRQRRRAGQRGRQAWAAVAAGLTLLAVFMSRRSEDGKPPGVPPAATNPAPMAPRMATTEPHPVEVPSASAAPSRPRVPPPAQGGRPAEPEVLVEPGQAELLVQFARNLRGTRQAPPGVSLPQIEVVGADAPAVAIPFAEAASVPAHRTEWETVEDQWPPMLRPL